MGMLHGSVRDRGRLSACLPACLPACLVSTKAWAPRVPGKMVSPPDDGQARLREQIQKVCARHYERLVRFALRFAGPGGRAAAEDIVQNALVALLTKGEPLPVTKAEQMRRVRWFVYNAGMKHASRKKRKRTTDLPDASSALLGDGTDGGEALEGISLRDSVRRALMNLTEAEREVVRLRFFEGLSYAEIADRRRCAVSTCKNQWASAQAKLKHCLSEVCGGSEGWRST